MSTVAEYMSSPVVCVSPVDTLAMIRNLMLKHRIGRVVVLHEGRIVGMVTKRDLVRVIFEHRDKPIDQILAKEIMSPTVYTIKADKPVRKAAELMLSRDISGLPVLDENDQLVGIITKSDLVRYFAREGSEKPLVRDYMTKNVLKVSPYHSIFQVIKIMETAGVARVIVEEDGRPVGIITESDVSFLRFHSKPEKLVFMRPIDEFRKVRHVRFLPLIAMDVMTEDPITIESERPLKEAASIMSEKKISGLPVTSGERLVGIISKSDVVRAIAR